MSRFLLAAFGLSLCALPLTGCGGSNVASVRSEDARAAVRDAREAVRDAEQRGAPEFAAEPLDLAKSRLAQAEEALQTGNNEVAMRLANEADVSADLAETRALSAKSQRAAREVRRSIELLREEIRRLQSE